MSEMDDFRENWKRQRLERAASEMKSHEKRIQNFIEQCTGSGFELNPGQIAYIETIGIVARCPGLVKSLCPDLSVDKDGLYDLSELRSLFTPVQFPETGLFLTEHFVIMAHPFFRRGMNGQQNWAPRFIEILWRTEIKTTKIKIALDPDRIRVNMASKGLIELDTWFGPSFQPDIITIKDELVQLRPPAYLDQTDLELFFGSAYSLHIKWATKGNIKTFQAEAFLQEDVIIEWEDDLWHPVRYVHSEFDLDKGEFRHFDGAIHFYNSQQYAVMRDADLNYNLKYSSQIKAPSVKLFRIDGSICIESWLTLTGHFFPHNPLILEYFDGDYPDHIKETLKRIQQSNSDT